MRLGLVPALLANPDADTGPESSSIASFVATIQTTDPGSSAGLPGPQVLIARGAAIRLSVGLELDGPAGSDRRLLSIGMALEKLRRRLLAPGR